MGARQWGFIDQYKTTKLGLVMSQYLQPASGWLFSFDGLFGVYVFHVKHIIAKFHPSYYVSRETV
jgi:hypothetical protein